MNDIYTVIDAETLRQACIKNNWFTGGTIEQYEKLFYANKHGCPIEEIATIIWLCSDEEVWCRRDILEELRRLRKEYRINNIDSLTHVEK